MPTKINYPFPNSSGGASLEFAGPVNASQSLNTSGYYFSDNLTDNIGIDCSGLGLGGYVNWVNLSTKAIVFYGLATVNGTTIPANQGVRIEANTSIEFFLKDANFNARVLSGAYTIKWIPGQEPPYITFTYVSPGDTNGVFYYLGATKYSQPFQNPHDRGEVTATGSSSLNATLLPQKVFDRANNNINNQIWHSNYENTGWLKIAFNGGKTFRITGFELWSSVAHSLSTYMGSNCLLQGSSDDNFWITIATFYPNVGAGSRFYSGLINSSDFYPYYRIYSPSNNYHAIGDVEFYGDLIEI